MHVCMHGVSIAPFCVLEVQVSCSTYKLVRALILFPSFMSKRFALVYTNAFLLPMFFALHVAPSYACSLVLASSPLCLSSTFSPSVQSSLPSPVSESPSECLAGLFERLVVKSKMKSVLCLSHSVFTLWAELQYLGEYVWANSQMKDEHLSLEK